MKSFSLRTIGIFILVISIMYPLNIMLQTGNTLTMALFGGIGNFTLLSEIGFVVGIILIVMSFLKKKIKKKVIEKNTCYIFVFSTVHQFL